ncbi:hypothetical protein TGAM01_v204198 [Trichoderma gamsii]|uniref:Heterokaryon incompatibility domain-containing protein n=1 Tax=Trichoderma gamsii TaxID=398673 RepID=A0A2P4ZQX2_9HYPO|nr:hypothetical protein TGAM01_v204198 [Trichoderma gamsii]PON26697.1 hypothetical protein TGAM01_v204198 [Trichoderma gamsii]
MNLLNVKTLRLEKCRDGTPYAILSHRWADGKEFLYEHITSDMTESQRNVHPGYAKVASACKQARLDGHGYIWIDNCCIDKNSSAELNEAINSMFNYYKEAQVCYAYLAGLSHTIDPYEADEFATHEWFSRGWTLQELIAPTEVLFFTDGEKREENGDPDGCSDEEPENERVQDEFRSNWVCLGRKSSMCDRLSSITGIDSGILSHTRDMRSISVAKRMSWASKRVTTRIEDRAYCLLGLFDISMPMLYGEGEKSFIRLQEEIMKESNDESLFLWTDDSADPNAIAGLLARSPDQFKASSHFFPYYDWEPRAPFFKTNQGLQITLPLRRVEDDIYVASLNCCQPMKTDGFAGLCLKRMTNFTDSDQSGYHDQYARIKTDKILSIDSAADRGNVQTFYVRQSTALPPSLHVYPEHIVQLRHGPALDQGYRLLGTMGRQTSNALSMTSSWDWVPAGIRVAFQVPKDANCLAAVIVLARIDDTKLTVLLGSSADPGQVASHVLDGCDEKRPFGEWERFFRPQPPDHVSYLQDEHVWTNIVSRVVDARKYFVVDIVIERIPSIFDELVDVLEETPLREALTVVDRFARVDTGTSESPLVEKPPPKAGRFKGILGRRNAPK